MNQEKLFREESDQQPRSTWDMAVTASYDQTRILRWIMQIYNDGKRFDADVTYSKGVFWRDLPEPKYKFDLAPQSDDVQQADARDLPLEDGSLGSLVCDLPFVLKDTERADMVAGIIESRFTGYPNITALYAAYGFCLTEFYRVLARGGICVFKCQDQVSGGKQHWVHYESMKMAKEIGFAVEDIFVLLATSVLWSPNMLAGQKHARKNHSFFLVLRKV